MEKRNWPWNRKLSERILTSSESSPVHYSSDDQENIVENGRISDNAGVQWKKSKEKTKSFNGTLSAISPEISGKEDVEKQHAEVAEEAVIGWEKAETEATRLRQELDLALQQKSATEDRVSHLDGALKECACELRCIREEQEKRVHEAVVKCTKEWERTRVELEQKLEEVTVKLQEAEAENRTSSNLRAQMGSEAKLLQVRLEAAEKESLSLKQEVRETKEELRIRDGEREAAKRRVMRLEAECQKLRIRKSTSPQIKHESERVDKKTSATKLAATTTTTTTATGLKSIPIEAPNMSSCLLTMEEEMKQLKEALAQRESELQAARIMCAKTASKLSFTEEQLEALSSAKESQKSLNHSLRLEAPLSSPSVVKELSVTSVSENGDEIESCSESWASALIAELAQFRKGSTHAQKLLTKNMDANDANAMDDFIEMERFASLPVNKTPDLTLSEAAISEKKREESKEKEIQESQLCLKQKETELKAAHELCKETSSKLAVAEEQLGLLRSKNVAHEANIANLQEKLDMIFEAKEEGKSLQKVLRDVQTSVGPPHTSVARLRAHIRRLSRNSHHGDDGMSISTVEDSEASICLDNYSTHETSAEPDMALSVCKLVRFIEELALVTTSGRLPSSHSDRKSKFSAKELSVDPQKRPLILASLQCKNPELDTNIQKLIAVSNQFLHSKAGVALLFAEISSVLKQITTISSSLTVNRINANGVDSPISDRVVPADDKTSNLSKDISVLSKLEQELRMVRSERAALESHLRAELSRFVGIEEKLTRLSSSNNDLQSRLNIANEKLQESNNVLTESERSVTKLRQELSQLKLLKDSVNEKLSNAESLKGDLEGKLKLREDELHQLHKRVTGLEKEILEEREKNEDLNSELRDLKKKLQRESGMNRSNYIAATSEDAILSKEQEMTAAAEKLAECQRTILALGKTLKELASPPGGVSSNASIVMGCTGLSTDSILPIESDTDANETGNMNNNSSSRIVNRLGEADWKQESAERDLAWGGSRDSDDESDTLDSELVNLSTKHAPNATTNGMHELFANKSSEHADFIDAVAQIPSSPETEATSAPPPFKSSKRLLPKKKKNLNSVTRVNSTITTDVSKSSNESYASDKHGNGFARFFSRTKGSAR